MSTDEIVQHILSHCPDLNREEVMVAVEKKRTDSGGFLTEEAAARLVAAEFGLKIKFEKPHPRIFIKQLVAGLNNVTISGRVVAVNMPKEFPRPDRNGKIARMLIVDKTGAIRVALWDEKAELARNVQLRQIVKIFHGYVRQSRNRELELHLGQRSAMQISPPDANESDFPSIRDLLQKISQALKAGNNVYVEGVIKTTYPISTFQRKDGSQGKVMRLVLEDETGKAPVVFWNEKVDEMAEASVGMVALLVNAKVRKNRQDESLELHIDNLSSVETQHCP
ncbi:MAG: hypothetical protein JSV51_08200 [Candidatus Bathyarchaeota archaeon]|nr:MAG: hypothetical protein JSV51_08200 [Candidatus Bathyarchaeota archaeon]